LIGRAQRIDETAANRLHVECRATRNAELALKQAGSTGENAIRCRGGDNDEIDIGWRNAGSLNGAQGGLGGQVTGIFILGRDVTLTDAGAGDNPLIRGIDHPLQIGIGQDSFRQVAAGARDAGIGHATPFLVMTACSISSCSLIFRNTPLLASSIATRMACWKAKLSAPPWLFTTTPRNPRKLAPL